MTGSGFAAREVRCFALVARLRSFSRAGAEIGLSQPAVSQAVARLERQLGLRLLERTSREVELTGAGRLLLPHVEALLDAASTLAAEAERIAAPAGEAIRLAYCPLAGALAGRVARRLAERKPSVEVELGAAGWAAATDRLARGGADAAIMTTPFPVGYATAARFHVPLVHLAVPARSPIASTRRLGVGQLQRFEVLLPRHRPPGSVWSTLQARLRECRIVTADLDNLVAGLDLVAAGRGLLPVPHLLVETVRRPDIRFVPVDLPDLRMTYGLVWSPEHASADVMALVQAVQETLRTR